MLSFHYSTRVCMWGEGREGGQQYSYHTLCLIFPRIISQLVIIVFRKQMYLYASPCMHLPLPFCKIPDFYWSFPSICSAMSHLPKDSTDSLKVHGSTGLYFTIKKKTNKINLCRVHNNAHCHAIPKSNPLIANCVDIRFRANLCKHVAAKSSFLRRWVSIKE